MLSQIVITGTRSYNTYPPLADINPQDSKRDRLPSARADSNAWSLPFSAVAAPLVLRLGGGRENGGNYLLRPVSGAVEMPKTDRHPHKVGNSARLHLLHDRGPVMLGRPRGDP